MRVLPCHMMGMCYDMYMHHHVSSLFRYVAPASSEVHATSTARGDWQALLDAGAIELPAGCGPCIGLGIG